MITDWNIFDMDNIIRLLNVFFVASGLRININKSNVFGIGISTEEIKEMARVIGFSGSLPFTYLGFPIGSNMNLVANWQGMVEKFKNRLSTWKARLLSIGGRLTLINAVLGSVGIYFMSIFRVLNTILNLLERLRAKFFWEGDENSRKLA